MAFDDLKQKAPRPDAVTAKHSHEKEEVVPDTSGNTATLVVSTPPQPDSHVQHDDPLNDDPDQYLWGV